MFELESLAGGGDEAGVQQVARHHEASAPLAGLAVHGNHVRRVNLQPPANVLPEYGMPAAT